MTLDKGIDAAPSGWGDRPPPHALPFGALYAPLGVPLRVDAAHPALLGAVAALCRGWEEPPDSGVRPLRLRLSIEALPPHPLEIAVDDARLELRADGIAGWADARIGAAECRLGDPRMLDDPDLRAAVLEPLVLFILTRRDRTPIHATGFVAGDLAVLLSGPSGSGKSCLAMAAHRAGYHLLSDDTVYVQLAPGLAVRGIPRPIHLYAADSPDHAGANVRIRNGKAKRAIDMSDRTAISPPGRAVICLLARGDHVALEPVERAVAIAELSRLEPGFDLLRSESARVFERLARGGAWRLTLGTRPEEAIEMLRDNLAMLREHAA